MKDLDVKKIRERLGLTQDELAKQIGVSRNTIINYEKGGVIPESKRTILGNLFKDGYIDNEENEVIIKGATPETIAQLAQLTFSEQLVRMFQDKEIAPYSLVDEKEEEIARLNEEIARLNLIVGRYEGLLQSHGVEYKQTAS